MGRRRRGPVAAAVFLARSPRRARRLVRRWSRDLVLRRRHRDHLAYYGAVVEDDIEHGDEVAVSNSHRPQWSLNGRMQFDYLTKHGLRPEHRMLEIGCGNLRAGWRFIDYLEAGNYYGVDIAPGVLFNAQRTVVQQRIAGQLPTLTLVRDMTFDFLPDEAFDLVHAHSVFSHSPIPVIEECFANIGRVMKPAGRFFFTFNLTDGPEYQHLREDFYYQTQTLVDLARRHGLDAVFMDDWEKVGHIQSTMRLTKASSTPP